MKYKVTRLDRRHTGYSFYAYSIAPTVRTMPETADLLVELRNWCWSTYGASAEIHYTRRGSTWAWDTEHGRKRIYLKSDQELALFMLKFAG